MRQGPQRGQLSGNVFYTILNAFAENNALYAVVREFMGSQPRWVSDWGSHAINCPTPELALLLHDKILNAPTLKVTRQTLNTSLDVSPYENPVVKKPEVALVTCSSLQTHKGDDLKPSIMIVGKTYAWKELMKNHFETIEYKDIVWSEDKVKSAWILPLSDQTNATGTLAEFFTKLGVAVTEHDIDDDSDDDDDDDEALNDDEADKASEE